MCDLEVQSHVPIPIDAANSMVCMLGTPVSPEKTAELTELPFLGGRLVGPGSSVVVGGVHWHHLANTIERPVCGGTVSNYFDHPDK